MTDGANNRPDAAVPLRLRPNPRPVLRLSRKMLIGLSGVCSIGLAAALAFAVMPAKPKTVAAPASDASSRGRPSTEALNTLPKDYTGVPQLGPPLPGDLGHPMLAAQQGPDAQAYVAIPPTPGSPVAAPSSAVGTAQQARLAAHNSQIFFPQTTGTLPPVSATLSDAPSDSAAMLPTWPPAGQTESRTEPDRKRAFLNQIADRQPVSDQRLTEPASPYLLMTGSVIPAALITGIRSDVPGQVVAQVTQDVRDSVAGHYLLIPRGSRLIGQYDNAIGFGQSRLLLVWSRLILPNGRSLVLDKLSAADVSGYAGLKDQTNYHWAGIVNAAAVSTLLGMGAEAGSPDDDTALIRALRDGAADSLSRTGQQVVQRQLNIEPTLTIRPGLPVRVILSRDLILEPYGDQ